MNANDDNSLGSFLQERRARLDPAALGLPGTPRDKPGLSLEEVAQRANVSAAWYNWLEQGRGGIPSPDLLERLAVALALSPAAREHLFLLAQRQAPRTAIQGAAASSAEMTPALQRVLDALPLSPAYIRNVDRELLALNRAAAAVLGIQLSATPELCPAPLLPERENGRLCIHHPDTGEINLDTAVLAVQDQPGLVMLIHTPVSPEDAKRVRALLVTRFTAAPPATA